MMVDRIKKSYIYTEFKKSRIFHFIRKIKDSEDGIYQRFVHYCLHKKKKRILDGYRRKYSLKVFIETGTYKGDMVAEFCKRGFFKSIFSIELSPFFYEQAVKRFSGCRNVFLLKGDSAEVLKKILIKIDEPCLFWLDAHYMKGETGKGNSENPIIEEINTILNHKIKNHVVIIDDAVYFNGTRDYPEINWFKDYVMRLRPTASFSVEKGVIRIVL